MKQKSTIWIALIVAPYFLLVFTALLQMFIRLNLNDSNVLVMQMLHIFSFLVGLLSALVILGTPIWIIMLVRSITHNNRMATQGTKRTPKHNG